MKRERNTRAELPVWYDRMLSNPLLLVVGIIAVLLASPLLFLYGALLPLFRR
ncbi:MAG: hypothetical protein PHP67_07795 [Sphaerochaeta sp.]|nr:hypothetical protein [Sphaerochaeta sp.]MDD4302048.1 hypothetical protein [Sphaerochaeta sp.]MDD4648109.1 hypothetical protein [Sphaerochaeta sp.]